MAQNKFPKNSMVRAGQQLYEYKGHLEGRIQFVSPSDGSVLSAPDAFGTVRPITDEQFDAMLLSGFAEVVSRPSSDRVRRMNDVSEWTIAQATKIEPAAEKMLDTCNWLDAAGVKNGRKAMERHFHKKWVASGMQTKHGNHDSPATIERWRAERGHPGSRHAKHMVRLSGKVPRGPYSADAPAELLEKHALLKSSTDFSVRTIYAGFADELMSVNEGRHPDYAQPDEPYEIPHISTFYRRCNRLEGVEATRASSGDKAVDQEWMGGGRTLSADFAMQRVIIDHTWLDLFVVHKLDDGEIVVLGRPWLTLAIDVATRAVVGYLISFQNPCVWTVGEIIWRIAMPKIVPPELAERYPMLRQIRGKMVELVVDNATEFRSHTLEAAARSAGFSVRFCPVRKPRYRAVGERAIGTFNRLICEGVPGATMTIAQANKYGYDATKHACATMDDVERFAHLAWGAYMTEPHPGVRNRQPALMFARDAAANGINNFVDMAAFRRDLMAIVEKATLRPDGIRFENLRYHHVKRVPDLLEDLVPLECRRSSTKDNTATVDFRYDPMDMGQIHVWNRKTRTYVELVCSDGDYADGLPLFVHHAVVAQAKEDAAAFNTTEERVAARSRLLQMKLHFDPRERNRIQEEMGRLYDVPRVRAITGTIANLELRPGEHVEEGDFVGHERPALTAFDHEVLSGRSKPKAEKGVRRDPRDAGRADPEQKEPTLRRRLPRESAK